MNYEKKKKKGSNSVLTTADTMEFPVSSGSPPVVSKRYELLNELSKKMPLKVWQRFIKDRLLHLTDSELAQIVERYNVK